MIKYDYQKTIDDLNSGKIKRIRFCVKNYSHYKDCIIERIEDTNYKGNAFLRIDVKLTKDSSENISFLDVFKDDYKMFNLGKKGSFSLRQIWSEIDILELDKS